MDYNTPNNDFSLKSLKDRLRIKLRETTPRNTVKIILTHFIIWVLYFFYENGALMIIDAKAIPLISSLLFFILNAFIFYVHTYLILPYTYHKKYIIRNILFTSALFAFYIERCYYMTNFLHEYGIAIIYSVSPFKTFFIIRLFRFIYIITISYLFWLTKYKIRNEKELYTVERIKIEQSEKMIRLEKEKLQADLNFLRTQINPHFLFNTLSFIYTEVLQTSEKTADSILMLSDIMSFALNPINREDKIDLSNELEHIQSLVKVHQLRFSQKLSIQLDLPSTDMTATVKIPALLLITFLENVFKYGDLSDPEDPCIFKIELTNSQFTLLLRNKINPSINGTETHGIGISNAVKRLDLIYGSSQYKLDIFDNKQYFKISLTINI